MPATALYASLLALLFLYLSVRTVRLRGSLRIGLGDGGNRVMTRAMRAHANFAEYVPLALLLMYIMERHTNSLWWVHTLGVLLVIARLSHAFGFGRDPERFQLRALGAGLTFFVIAVEALRLLWVWTLSALLA
jgi:uncharacterized membrane protein YecN with MAPEG domain